MIKKQNNNRSQSNWQWGFYNNPDDNRIMVPKRIPALGWTVNIGQRKGRRIMTGIIALMMILFGWIGVLAKKDYQFTVGSDTITIDAPMYDRTYARADIVSVTTITKLPPGGIRTNGYGGLNKAFGHFRLDDYGKTMLYVYKKVPLYIVIELANNDKQHVIFNTKSTAETEQLYMDIQHMMQQ